MLHAHLLEIRNLQLTVQKNLAYKGVDFYVINAPNLAYIRASVIPKIFPRIISPDPRERGGTWRGRKKRGAERRESRGEGCVMAVGGIDAPGLWQHNTEGHDYLPRFLERYV